MRFFFSFETAIFKSNDPKEKLTTILIGKKDHFYYT